METKVTKIVVGEVMRELPIIPSPLLAQTGAEAVRLATLRLLPHPHLHRRKRKHQPVALVRLVHFNHKAIRLEEVTRQIHLHSEVNPHLRHLVLRRIHLVEMQLLHPLHLLLELSPLNHKLITRLEVAHQLRRETTPSLEGHRPSEAASLAM